MNERRRTWAGELVVEGVGSLAGRGGRVGRLRADRVQRDLAGQDHRPGSRHHLLQEPTHHHLMLTLTPTLPVRISRQWSFFS